MGFWHTAYFEFHEESGLGDFKPPPPQFPCGHCDIICDSFDDLRKHRFESHPLHRPTLFVQGRELGKHPQRITRPLTADDVQADKCDRAFLNGCEISIDRLPCRLSHIRSDSCKLVLSKGTVSAEFTLDFRIASESDLRGVEESFESMVRGQRLDIETVGKFIGDTSQFDSARGYFGGICAYLHGVLAKEQTPGSSLPYGQYIGKFNKAAEELAAYKRPLAQTIGSLIEFHFNHFKEAARLVSETRVGRAATRYAAWLQDRRAKTEHGAGASILRENLDALVTDRETEQIIRWAVRPLNELSQHITDMESFLGCNLDRYDGVKLNILLSETYAAAGDVEKALQHAKTLRNLLATERWAKSMIFALRGLQ